MEVLNKKVLHHKPQSSNLHKWWKKNKLNKIDIVGFFFSEGKLEKGDLGLIEVKDFISLRP
jgi:hypothetical protein